GLDARDPRRVDALCRLVARRRRVHGAEAVRAAGRRRARRRPLCRRSGRGRLRRPLRLVLARDMNEPRFSMLEYVTLDLPFAEELAAFRAGGATGVGVTEFTGPKGRDVEAMRRELERAEMAVTVGWPEVPSILPLDGFPGETDPVVRTEQLCEH